MKKFTEADVVPWAGAGNIWASREDLVEAPMWWHRRGLQETATGYGARLTMSRKIHFEGRLRRLYCTIYSNNGSVWFETRGRRIYVN